MSLVLHKLRKSEKGFSMAEVVIAMAVFVSAILGISMMLMSGSGAVTRGAMESTATQLAQKKIEDVKTLPFYSPWTGIPNKDIDDFYWNFNASGTDKNATQLTTEQPHENTLAYEDYGHISGFGKYKRTTAIQYQMVTPSQLVSTAMNDNWVPKNPEGNKVVSPNFDMQKDTSGNKVHLLIVEVRVYYRLGDSGQQMSYAERAVVSDLMVTGSTNNPALVVKSVTPAEGQLNSKQLKMDITVQSEGLTSTDIVSVSLWYAGQTSIPGKSVTIKSSTLISCEFDLTAHQTGITVRPGMYNLEVYWKNKGWKDTSFRNCFTVTVPPPTFTSISPAWGYNGQSARPVVISGSDFLGATVNLERNNGTIIPATETIVSSDGTKINCNFDLRNISDTEYCDIVITTLGGVIRSDTDAKRLWVNPPPQVTSVTCTPTTLYRKCSYTNAVVVIGKYFQSDIPPTVMLSKTGCNSITGVYATGGAVTETGDVTSFTMSFLDLRCKDTSDINRPIEPGKSTNEVGKWTLSVTNQDGQECMMTNAVTVGNAPLEISAGWSNQRCWDWDISLIITGKYFDPSNTTVSFLGSDGNPYNPESVSTLTGVGTPSGVYDGSVQTISRLLNLINVPPATYTIRVTDTENNLYVDKILVTTYQKPGVPYYINPTVVTEGTNATLAVRAKGMYYGNCSFTVKFWEMVKHGNDWVHNGDNKQTSNSSPQVTWSRSDKYVQVTSTVPVPVDVGGVYYKTGTYGAQPEIMVTNPIGDSDYWTGGHPQVI